MFTIHVAWRDEPHLGRRVAVLEDGGAAPPYRQPGLPPIVAQTRRDRVWITELDVGAGMAAAARAWTEAELLTLVRRVWTGVTWLSGAGRLMGPVELDALRWSPAGPFFDFVYRRGAVPSPPVAMQQLARAAAELAGDLAAGSPLRELLVTAAARLGDEQGLAAFLAELGAVAGERPAATGAGERPAAKPAPEAAPAALPRPRLRGAVTLGLTVAGTVLLSGALFLTRAAPTPAAPAPLAPAPSVAAVLAPPPAAAPEPAVTFAPLPVPDAGALVPEGRPALPPPETPAPAPPAAAAAPAPRPAPAPPPAPAPVRRPGLSGPDVIGVGETAAYTLRLTAGDDVPLAAEPVWIVASGAESAWVDTIGHLHGRAPGSVLLRAVVPGSGAVAEKQVLVR